MAGTYRQRFKVCLVKLNSMTIKSDSIGFVLRILTNFFGIYLIITEYSVKYFVLHYDF